MKKFIIGFLLGAFLFSVMPISAAIKEITVKTTDINFQVDGQIIDIKTTPLNYNNYNYAPVRPIVEAMGGAIAMDSNTNTVVITSNKNEDAVDGEISSVPSTPTNAPEQKLTPDGIKADFFNGEWYVYIIYVNQKWNEDLKLKKISNKYSISPIVNKGEEYSKTAQLLNRTVKPNIIFDNIPLFTNKGSTYIKYDFYINNILPLIN